jgi:two-component system, cell cycle sensor histidine kinase and response regulator CckA
MPLSTTRKFSIGLFAVTALAVLFAGIAYLSLTEISARSGWVTHTNRVLLALGNMAADLSAAESGERGYLLTGKAEYLEPYLAVRDAIPGRLDELRRLVQDNPRQAASIDSLRQVVPERLAVIKEILDSAEQHGVGSASAIVSAGRGKALMETARRLLLRMTDQERALLDERIQEQRAGVERSTHIVAVGLGLAVILCAVGAVTILTDHEARARATAEILRLGREAELAAARSQEEAARADEERRRAEDEAIKAGDAAAEAEQSAQEAANAMAELARSEREIREFFENATVGLHWADASGIIQRVNHAELDMLGYGAAEYVGRPVTDFHVDREVMEDVLRRVGAGEVVVNREARLRCKDGSIRQVLLDCSGYWEREELIHTRCFTRDITERKTVEERLRQVERIESVGRLAGGVAHEVNNQVSVVLGAADFLLRRDDLSPAARADAELIRNAGERSAAVTAQLLAFSRQQFLRPEVVDLNRVISEFEPVLRRVMGEHSLLTLRLQANLPRIRADRGQLEQVLLNLALNATDAMPAGGTLSIETGTAHLSEEYSRRRPGIDIQHGQHVVLRLSDTGHGIPKNLQEKIFDPFFTTKPVGQGTGLGLSTVYGIVKQSEGYIWVYSEVGVGTAFKIYLPAVEEGVSEQVDTQVPAPRKSDETILVVEDEPAVREMIVRILSAEGYVVLEAKNGHDALTVVEGHGKPIALVLTDVAMPEMGGQELGLRLAKLAPALRVIYMSGFTDEEVVRRGLLQHDVPIVQKPLMPESLTRRIRAILDGVEV